MTKTRLEAFSDGVLAIIITIMVLELKVPHGTDWASIKPTLAGILSYIISFIIVGVYWANHHHLLHTVTHVNSKMIWANLHLLFWLSLIPFATNWMGENNFSSITVAVYAGLQFVCGSAYSILLFVIGATIPENSGLREILKKQSKKGIISAIVYLLSIPVAFFNPIISGCLFVMVSMIWWVPDKNIESFLNEKE